jgi:hypothetical protein
VLTSACASTSEATRSRESCVGRDVSTEPGLEATPILEVLRRHGVRFVMIGGLAAVVHGAAHVTNDIDITPEQTRDNLARLSAALRELAAEVRASGEGHSFDQDADSLAEAKVWNLSTPHGDLDITFEPAGTFGYDDLKRDAITVLVFGAKVDVASLADVIRSKEAAGREKDRVALPVLRRLLEEGGGLQ